MEEEFRRGMNTSDRPKEKAGSILKFAGVGVYGMDPEGRCTFVNDLCLKLLGYKAEDDLVGQEIHPLVHRGREGDVPIGMDRCRICQVVRTGIGVHLLNEPFIRKTDGEFFPVEIWAEPILRNGKPGGAVVCFQDISLRKRDEETLLQYEKRAIIATLSSGVAHEILNPLNIISTIVQIMKTENPSPETLESLNEILSQIRRAAKIVDNLRQFARPGKGEIQEVDLHRLFDLTASLIEKDLLLDNIKIFRKFGRKIPKIRGDEDKLGQAFLILLTNSRDALGGQKNGLITVQTEVENGGLVLRFSDNGPGIPPEIVSRIFDPFFSTKEPGKGTGLGLSLLFSIVEAHGGTLRVESQPDKGTTFIIKLPYR